MSKKKIGIYGGSFDPIHFGHLSLALEIYEKKQLDEIWFCPAYKNPLKLNQAATEGQHRLAMILLALEDLPQFKLLDIEIYKIAPSYTVDTLRHLASDPFNLSAQQLFLIIGTDAFLHFSAWKEPQEILQLASLIIGTRVVHDQELLNAELLKWHMPDSALVSTKILEISSTDIRERFVKGLYCGHLLPAKVIDYIYDHHLYLS